MVVVVAVAKVLYSENREVPVRLHHHHHQLNSHHPPRDQEWDNKMVYFFLISINFDNYRVVEF